MKHSFFKQVKTVDYLETQRPNKLPDKEVALMKRLHWSWLCYEICFARVMQLIFKVLSQSRLKRSLFEQSYACTVYSRFMLNFECSSSSDKQNRTAKEKHTRSGVHHQANSESVPACVLTGPSDMAVVNIGDASPSLNVVPAANIDTTSHIVVFNQSVQEQLGMPSLVTHASPEPLESSSSFSSVTLHHTLDTEPIATSDATPHSMATSGSTERRAAASLSESHPVRQSSNQSVSGLIYVDKVNICKFMIIGNVPSSSILGKVK
ncbi:hypothetical protein Tco_1259682 [Tanacetum coccineum]